MAASSFDNQESGPAAVVGFDPTAGLTLELETSNDSASSPTSASHTPSPSTFTIAPTNIVCTRTTAGSPSTYRLLYVHNSHGESKLDSIIITHAPEPFLERYLLDDLPPHLKKITSDVTVIISTTSGSGSAASFYDSTLSPLLSILQLSPSIIRTTTATSIAEAISSLSTSRRPQTILLLSGDTGIHDAINAYSPRAPTTSLSLCIFPLGTGNALASSLHTSRNISALTGLLLGEPHRLPTFTARFSPGARYINSTQPIASTGITGAVVVSWGFHASLVADAEALRAAHPNTHRFKIAAAQNLEPPHPYRGILSILPPDFGSVWRRIERKEHFYALATMCSNLEEAFRISPCSRLGEDVIRLVHFAPMGKEDVLNVMGGAYQGGTHVDDDRVGYEVARGVKIEVHEDDKRWRRVCVDGDTVVVPTGGWVELVVDEGTRRGVNVVWRD